MNALKYPLCSEAFLLLLSPRNSDTVLNDDTVLKNADTWIRSLRDEAGLWGTNLSLSSSHRPCRRLPIMQPNSSYGSTQSSELSGIVSQQALPYAKEWSKEQHMAAAINWVAVIHQAHSPRPEWSKQGHILRAGKLCRPFYPALWGTGIVAVQTWVNTHQIIHKISP